MNKANHFISKAIATALKYIEGKRWSHHKSSLLADVDPSKLVIYETLLDNLHAHHTIDRLWTLSEAVANVVDKLRKNPVSPTDDEVLYKITKRVLDKLEIMNLVGVQPMQAPVGMVYAMRYNEYSEEIAGTTLRLEIVSSAVKAMSKRLCARLSLEAASDLKMLHNIDIVEEISSTVAMEIASDLNQTILRELATIAEPVTINAPLETYEDAMRFVLTVTREANNIAIKTRRGPGSWVVVNPQTFTMLQTYADKIPTSSLTLNTQPTFQIGSLLHVGYIASNIKLYVAIGMESTALMGYKGKREFDTGFIFCPYIVQAATSVVIDPASFQPQIGFFSRYGTFVNDGPFAKGGAYYRQINFVSDTEEK